MRLLSLDLSTKTGWALWSAPFSRPVCGTHRLAPVLDPEDYGTRCWSLMGWLEAEIFAQQAIGSPIKVIALESPFIPMGPASGAFNTTAQTLRLQIGLATVIETVAKKHHIRCIEVTTQSAKMKMLGFARKPHPKFDWKKEMLVEATRRGYSCADDHQADAIAVGLVAYDHIGESVSDDTERAARASTDPVWAEKLRRGEV